MADAFRKLAWLSTPIAVGTLFGLSSSALAAPGDRNDPDIQDYALRCFKRVAVDPKDLAGPFDCTKGTPLPTMVHGKIQDEGQCTGSSCPTDFPPECDFPAWLGADNQCYGHSFITSFRPASNAKVRVALLCRHKSEWTKDPKNFDDIAMIVHNQGNGETCWFQTDSDEVSIAWNGKEVPGPATRKADQFWLRPKQAAAIDCYRCHDSSPFMVSPWMRNAVGTFLDDRASHPYKYNEKPFDRWPVPRFVKIGRFGLASGQGDRACTSCHKIAAGGRRGGREMQTCNQWIDWVTGAGSIPSQNTTRDSRNVWMPLSRGEVGPHDHAEFKRRYGAHVKHLKKCCAAAAGVKPGDPTGVKDCEVFAPKPGPPRAAPARTPGRVRRRGDDIDADEAEGSSP